MKVISVGTLKGGSGKTTTAVTCASILASEYNKRVLLVDADPQANTTSFMGVDETASGYLSIKDVLENENISINQVIKPTSIKGLDIIGSTILLTGTEMKLVTLPAREFVLRRVFNKNRELLEQYDYIIADTNPSMSVVNQNVFAISNSIVLVSDVGIGSFKGIELFDFLWNDIREKLDIENNIKAILITKQKARTKLSKEYNEYVSSEDLTKDIILKTIIKDSIKFAEAELEQKPINLYDKNSVGAIEYREVVKELIERGVF